MKPLLLLFVLSLLPLTAPAQVENTGSLHLEGTDTMTTYGLPVPEHGVPEIALATMPTDVAQSWGTSVGSTPSSDVVATVIQALRDFGEGKNEVGTAWWAIVMLIAGSGSLVSFYFTTVSVSRGEAELSDYMTWALRSGASMFIVGSLAGAAPWLVIDAIDSVTNSVSGSTAQVVANAQKNTESNYYIGLLAQQVRQAATMVASTENPTPSASTAATPALLRSAATAVTSVIGTAPTNIDQPTFIKAHDALATWVLQQYGALGADGTTDLTMNGSDLKNYEAIKDALGEAPPFYQDAATSTWKSTNTAMYVFATEIAISIWVLPVSFGLWGSFLAWPAMAGFPKFWSLALKAFITLILSSALASAFAYSAMKTVAGSPQQNQGGYWNYLSSQMSRFENGDIVGAGEATANEGVSLLASVTGNQWMAWLTGTSWQMKIVTAMIIAAPIMAATAVAGGAWGASLIKAAHDNPSGGSSWGSWTGQVGSWDAGAGGAGSAPKTRREMLE